MANLEKWTGKSKIVFSIDIGTTHSAVSFVYLQSGCLPQVEQIPWWPDQPYKKRRPKTLTAIYYDKNGKPRSFGVKTQTAAIQQKAEEDQWLLVHSFKRLVHRLGGAVDTNIPDNEANLPTLPPNITPESVYTDWLKYLFEHAQSIFVAKYTRVVWDQLSPGMEIIFTVPNGWYTQEHGLLGSAAIAAGIVKDNSKIHFVPETEAAVHFGLWERALRPSNGMNFIVCDTGGSTTDIALYIVKQVKPLQLQEKQGFPSKCIEAGSALIDDAFDETAGQLLVDKFGEGEDTDERKARVLEDFAEAKPEFAAEGGAYVFNTAAENEDKDLPDNQLEVPHDEVAKHFDNEIDKITAGIDELRGNNDPKYLLLLGDFGHSPYLQTRLKGRYEPSMSIIQAGDKTVKAAADGALIWFLQHSVTARAARYAFGQEILVKFNPNDAEHVRRGSDQRPDGDFVWHGWDEVVPRGVLLKDEQEYKRSYYRTYTVRDAVLSDFETTVYAADDIADSQSTKWVRNTKGELTEGFKAICTIKGNLSNLQGKLPTRTGPRGTYWYLDFQVAIAFGSTSLDARILWKEGNKSCSGLATVIPAEFT